MIVARARKVQRYRGARGSSVGVWAYKMYKSAGKRFSNTVTRR